MRSSKPTRLPKPHSTLPMSGPRGYVYLSADGCPTLRVPVASADMASALLTAYRDKYGIGASDMNDGSGNVIAEDGTLVARVLYNGRVWTPEGTLLQEPPHCPNDK